MISLINFFNSSFITEILLSSEKQQQQKDPEISVYMTLGKS